MICHKIILWISGLVCDHTFSFIQGESVEPDLRRCSSPGSMVTTQFITSLWKWFEVTLWRSPKNCWWNFLVMLGVKYALHILLDLLPKDWIILCSFRVQQSESWQTVPKLRNSVWEHSLLFWLLSFYVSFLLQ